MFRIMVTQEQGLPLPKKGPPQGIAPTQKNNSCKLVLLVAKKSIQYV